MLTLLKPPSPGSSADSREVEVTLPHPIPTMSQFPDGPPLTPPDACVQEHRDMIKSSGVALASKRWLQRFTKTNEKRASSPPHSTKSSRPATPQSGSKLQSGVNTTRKRTSWYIPGQRVRVGVLFFSGQTMRGVPDQPSPSQRAVVKPVNWVRLLFSLLAAPLCIPCCRVQEIPRPLR